MATALLRSDAKTRYTEHAKHYVVSTGLKLLRWSLFAVAAVLFIHEWDNMLTRDTDDFDVDRDVMDETVSLLTYDRGEREKAIPYTGTVEVAGHNNSCYYPATLSGVRLGIGPYRIGTSGTLSSYVSKECDQPERAYNAFIANPSSRRSDTQSDMFEVDCDKPYLLADADYPAALSLIGAYKGMKTALHVPNHKDCSVAGSPGMPHALSAAEHNAFCNAVPVDDREGLRETCTFQAAYTDANNAYALHELVDATAELLTKYPYLLHAVPDMQALAAVAANAGQPVNFSPAGINAYMNANTFIPYFSPENDNMKDLKQFQTVPDKPVDVVKDSDLQKYLLFAAEATQIPVMPYCKNLEQVTDVTVGTDKTSFTGEPNCPASTVSQEGWTSGAATTRPLTNTEKAWQTRYMNAYNMFYESAGTAYPVGTAKALATGTTWDAFEGSLSTCGMLCASPDNPNPGQGCSAFTRDLVSDGFAAWLTAKNIESHTKLVGDQHTTLPNGRDQPFSQRPLRAPTDNERDACKAAQTRHDWVFALACAAVGLMSLGLILLIAQGVQFLMDKDRDLDAGSRIRSMAFVANVAGYAFLSMACMVLLFAPAMPTGYFAEVFFGDTGDDLVSSVPTSLNADDSAYYLYETGLAMVLIAVTAPTVFIYVLDRQSRGEATTLFEVNAAFTGKTSGLFTSIL